MIPVIYKKPNFLNTLQYVLGKDGAAIISTNMTGTTPDEFNQQFLNTKYSNKAVKLQCAHLIISIVHRDNYHEHLSDSQYSYVAKEYLKDMGYLPKDNSPKGISQYVAVRHSDRNHEHLHIIASRIRLDGSLVNDSYDYFNSQVSTRRIAAQLGLEVTSTTNEAVALKLEQEYGITASTSPNRSKSIKAINSKHKTPTSKEMIREAIGEAIQDSPSVSTFIQRLEENNIAVLPKMRGDELLGFTYIHNNVKIAGYQVYKPYSWNKLQSEYRVTYDRDRDKQVIQQAKTKAINCINNTDSSYAEYSYSNKATNSSTSDSNGDADSNINLFDSKNILSNFLEKGLTTPTLEKELAAAKTSVKKKVKPEQLNEKQPSTELSSSLSQNTPSRVETEVKEELPPPLEELRQPTQVKIAEVEEKVSRFKEKSRGEQKLSADNGAISLTEEQPSLINDSSTHNASRFSSSETPSSVCAPRNRDAEVPTVADPPTPVAPLQSNIKDLVTVITNYMLVTNSYRINGRELSASLDGNVLTVCRHGDDIPVMQTRYHNGKWHEEIPTQLTTNEIEQIESLRVFTQQALINRSRINWGIEQ
ncbi:relaxase/mobilization nuclease domain-containing protein [Scytonema sp. UIC 10036]|uniref:relaxase/mobilization nuclease domain-containing protein n=1 Tax=Scytonema sp. UIC 10036 TaxID=2304196 RepID=UPI00137D9F7B|nr:relaxase/mobilization nuclease domain-containing protein [Scytonema sp. UIC 10036]